MKNLLISITLILLTQTVFASSKDTLTKPKLTYHSTFEKSNFQTYIIDKQFDTLGFLLAIDSSMTKDNVRTVKNDLATFYNNIDFEGNKKKKNLKKYIDFLFTNIHDHFLKKYEENVPFHRIFKDGVYNCVTATALYALVFEHYGIRYAIKELPTHVYLVADPEGLSILIETTDPKGGYFAPSDKFKKKYITQLLAAKLVTDDELDTEGGQKIFEKFYYENKNANATLQQLVAFLYSNKALALNDLEENQAALQEIEKANFLYPCERMKQSLIYTIYAEIEQKHKQNKHETNDIEVVKLATKLYRLVEFSEKRTLILTAFESLSKEILIRKNNPTYYDQVYAVFQTSMPDSATLAGIEFIYNASKAEEAYWKSKFKLSLDYTAKCLTINPEDLPMKSNYVNSLLQSFGNSRDATKILSELEAHEAKFPFLSENEAFLRGKAISLMGIAGENCYKDKFTESLPYFERFEKLMVAHPMTFEGEAVGSAYGEASSYCIRKLIDYGKAREWLNRGFKYEPNSETLKRKLSVLDENPTPSKSNVSTEDLPMKVINLKEMKLSSPPKPKKTKN